MSNPRRIKALQTVRQLAETDKDQAAARLQAQQQSLQLAEEQLAQLEAFYADYAAGLHNGGEAKPQTARYLQQRYSFLAKIDSSLVQQRHMLTGTRQTVEESRVRWANLHQRSEALQKVLNKAIKQYAQDRDKRERDSA